MGGSWSCRPSSKFNSVRVVHLSGFVEDFEGSVTVSHVTGNPTNTKHFVCTPTELLSFCSKALKDNTQLQPGKIYFMLPFSMLEADISPVDWASTVKKLSAIAKTSRARGVTKSTGAGPLLRSCSLELERSPRANLSRYGGSDPCVITCGRRRSNRVMTWKPLLATIRE